MTGFLQFCGIVTALAYTAALFTANIAAYVLRPETYRHLVLAVKWARIALALAVVTLLLGLVRTSIDGSKWWIPATWAFNTACVSLILHVMCKNRDRKGERLVDEALEQINDWKWRR